MVSPSCSSYSAESSFAPIFCVECDSYHSVSGVTPVGSDYGDFADDESCNSSAYPTPRVIPAQVYMADIADNAPPEGTPTGSRVPVPISEAAMARARAAISGGVPMPEDASREELMAYHHLLKQAHDQMHRTRVEFDERRQQADESSERRRQLSSTRQSSSSRRTLVSKDHEHRSRVHRMPRASRREMTRNLDSSFMTVDPTGGVVHITPQAAVIVATTYLLSTQPPENDPRAALHREMI